MIPKRLMQRIDIQDRNFKSPCWIWIGKKDRYGYGYCHFEGEKRPAHRVFFRLFYGYFPPYPGFHVDHLCRNRDCVNPDHLEKVTPQENASRAKPFRPPDPKSFNTHCVNGHEFTDQNTYLRPSGSRDCRACIRSRVRKYQSKRSAA